MGGRTPRRWRAAAGLTAAGLAVGAFGGYRAATAEPINGPLMPVPLSQPKEDQPKWGPSSGGAIPAAGTKPAEPPKVPTLPAPAVEKPAPPALPALPTIPSGPPAAGSTPKPPPSVKEELPQPRPAGPEVAPPARPVKSAEPAAPALPAAPVFNLQPAEPRHTVIPGGPAAPAVPAIPTGRPGPAEPNPAPVRVPAPTVPTSTPTSAPGDPEMTLPTRQLVMSAVFGAALAAAPVAKAQDNKTADASKDGDVKSMLEGIKRDVDSLKRFQKNIEDEVFGKGDGKAAADKGLIARMTALESRLTAIETMLHQINAKLGDGGRSTSGFTPQPGPTVPAGRAYVRIVNDYPTEMSLVVNARSYQVKPGEVRTVEVPPGSYTYELLSAGAAPITSTVKDGETVTLRIR